MGRKVINHLPNPDLGMEYDLQDGTCRSIRFCKIQEIHPDDKSRARESCSVADPSGVIAGIRWVRCSEEAVMADANPRIREEEKWAKTLCKKHFLEAAELMRTIALQEFRKQENKMLPPKNPNKAMSLDELLSPVALQQLNEYGYVQFNLVGDRGDTIPGWISRKTKKIVEQEHIVISTSVNNCF